MFKIILMVASIAITKVRSDSGQCCSTDQVVIRKKSNQYNCWDPNNNTTSLMPINCNETGILTPEDVGDFHVNGGGQLVIDIPNFEVEFDSGTFCVGNLAPRKNVSRAYRMALVCYEERVQTIADEVFGFCMVVSTILLLITAAIYIILPDLRDLQGKSLNNFCLSLAIGLGIIAVMKLVSYSDMSLCAARGFLAYFFVIASFFWMNAISIQILLNIRRPSVLNYGWTEFIYYAIYAWGCPAVLTIAMAIVNYAPGTHLKPGIGFQHCWFFNKKQQWYYMYSVMSVLIILNIFIFLYISFHLWRQSFSSSHVKALRYKFMMTFRMSVVMGVAWIFEMISSVANSHLFWEIMDLINSLQGVLIFLVLVVFRRRVVKTMHRHGWLDWCSGPVERYLAVGEDEEDVVQHTMGLTMDETKNNGQ